jgi:hypothetical protein
MDKRQMFHISNDFGTPLAFQRAGRILAFYGEREVDLSLTAQNSANNAVYQGVNGSSVTSAIKLASAQTGVDFSYLVKKADVESSMDPKAKSSSSSATGLFQFVEQTWLRVIKAYGDKYGLTSVADRINIGSDGVARVADNSTRQAILNLRKDPQVSSQMAAELTNENRETLETKVGGKIGSTELYLAHFLGAGGATTFLKQMRANPQAAAADYLPSAASANPTIFYDKEGQPRSLGQIYKHFASKFDGTYDAFGKSQIRVAGVANMPSTVSSLSGLTQSLGLGRNSRTDSVFAAAKGQGAEAAFMNAMMATQMNIGAEMASGASLDALFGTTAASQRKTAAAAYASSAA